MTSEPGTLGLESDLRRAAGNCTRRCTHLFEDFLQEMWVAVLEAPPGQTRSWYIGRAAWLARHWLRRETRYRARHRSLEESRVCDL